MSAAASPELCAFVLKQAPAHFPASDAPNSWPALQRWHAVASKQGWPRERIALPVYDGGAELTIYPDNATNYAFRAWHDSLHLLNGYSFSREHEIKVGLIHMQQARAAGLSKRDQDMLIADTIGQNEYYVKYGAYVDNQAAFVGAVLDSSLLTVLDSGTRY